MATSANVVGKVISIENPQIVNGLQTTETIYKYFSEGGIDEKNRKVLVKIIISSNNKTRDRIIKATNNQTPINQHSLHATDKIQRDIEDIMLKNELYYERRENYYINQGVSKDLIISPTYLACGFVSLILKLPNQSVNFKFMDNMGQYSVVFSEDVPLELWPIIARILKHTDYILELQKEEKKIRTDRYLSKLRHIVSFVAISKLMETYDFKMNELLRIDLKSYNEALIIETLEDILKIKSLDIHKMKWKKRKFILEICEILSIKYSINGFEMIKSKNSIYDWFKLDLNEEFIMRVKEKLPTQPWKRNMHLKMAKKLKCHEFKISRAIDILIERGEVYKQKDGQLFDEDGNLVEI